nr:MAG TPA: hypothetical protein [Caudoviricetes sp.]
MISLYKTKMSSIRLLNLYSLTLTVECCII